MNYWKEHFEKNAQNYPNLLKKQVDMTINKVEVDDLQVQLRVRSIIDKLKLNSSNVLLDLCCGNGLLTSFISEKVKFVYAVDFSSSLLKVARRINHKNNIKYIEGDVSKLDFKKFDVDKVAIYSCFQYLSMEQVSYIFLGLSTFSPILVYIGNIPDKSKFLDYYDTKEKLEFYHKSIEEGKPHIGNWYFKDDLASLAKKYKFGYKFLDINSQLNTSNYRFDLVLEK